MGTFSIVEMIWVAVTCAALGVHGLAVIEAQASLRVAVERDLPIERVLVARMRRLSEAASLFAQAVFVGVGMRSANVPQSRQSIATYVVGALFILAAGVLLAASLRNRYHFYRVVGYAIVARAPRADHSAKGGTDVPAP